MRTGTLTAIAFCGWLVLVSQGFAQTPHPSTFGPPPPPYAPREPIAIVGGTLIDGTGGAPRTGYTVLIEGRTIQQVAPSDKVIIPKNAMVLDASGFTVMPGLINSNGHISLSPLYPGPATDFPLAELKRRWKEMGDGAEQRAYIALMQGVTTMRHTGGSYRPANVPAVKQRIDAGEIPGPRLFFSGGLLTSEAAFRSYIKENHTPAESLDYVRNEWVFHVIENVEQDLQPILSDEFSYWKLRFDDAPFDGKNDFTDAEIERIIEVARKLGKSIDVHANDSNAGFRRLLKFDIDSIEHPFANDYLLDEDILEGYAEKGVIGVSLIVTRTVRSNLARDPNRLSDTDFIMSNTPEHYRTLMVYRDKMLFNKRNPDLAGLPVYQPNMSESDMFGQSGPSLNQQLTEGETVRENVRRWLKAGVRLAMGTDGTTFLNFQQLTPEATEMMTMVQLGMTPMDTIVSATRTGAELLGMLDQLGTVEPGKLADVIVVEDDPLADMAAMKRVVFVVKDGIRFK